MSSDNNLQVFVNPQKRISSIGISNLVFEVVQGDKDGKPIIRHDIDIVHKEPHEIDAEFGKLIDRAVLEERLPVGIKAGLVWQFRLSCVRLLGLKPLNT